MLGSGAIPAFIQLLGLLFVVPESPRWLFTKSLLDSASGEQCRGQAISILQRIRGDDANIEDEIREIEASIQQESQTGWRELLSPAVRPALLVGVALQVSDLRFVVVCPTLLTFIIILTTAHQFFQQFCGINTAMYYSPTILKKSGFDDDAVAIWL